MAIYKCSWEVEPGSTRIKFNEWSERVLNPGSLDLKASALTTGPHCLLLTELDERLSEDPKGMVSKETEIVRGCGVENENLISPNELTDKGRISTTEKMK